MDRRTLIVAGAATFAATATRAQQTDEVAPSVRASQLPPAAPAAERPTPPPPPAQNSGPTPNFPANNSDKTYSRDEIVNNVSDFMGVTAEAAGGVVEKVFSQNGRPSGYIAGEEGSGAIAVGARYGRGLLYMKNREPVQVYWQGPSVGWDFGGNASRVFTLCYNLDEPDTIFQRFPGVEGTAYFIGGMGVNYQRANNVTLAPIRAGVGLRLGANVGYLAYTRKRNLFPF